MQISSLFTQLGSFEYASLRGLPLYPSEIDIFNFRNQIKLYQFSYNVSQSNYHAIVEILS